MKRSSPCSLLSASLSGGQEINAQCAPYFTHFVRTILVRPQCDDILFTHGRNAADADCRICGVHCTNLCDPCYFQPVPRLGLSLGESEIPNRTLEFRADFLRGLRGITSEAHARAFTMSTPSSKRCLNCRKAPRSIGASMRCPGLFILRMQSLLISKDLREHTKSPWSLSLSPLNNAA